MGLAKCTCAKSVAAWLFRDQTWGREMAYEL